MNYPALYGELPPSVTHSRRSYTLISASGVCFDFVLVISQGGERKQSRDVYAVCEYYPDCEEDRYGPFRYLIVCKCGPPTDEREGLYLVRLPRHAAARANYGPPVCECFGYSRWQACKHIAALSDLLNRGKL